MNRLQRQIVIQKLQEKLYILKGRTIALLGLAFKPNTDDLRDAPSLQIAEKLIQMGARVRAYDPIAMDACRAQNPSLRICYCNDALSAAEHADALVLVTEWPEFANLNLEDLAGRMNRAVLIDGRNLYHPEKARQAGFEYSGIGRASRTPLVRSARRQEPNPLKIPGFFDRFPLRSAFSQLGQALIF